MEEKSLDGFNEVFLLKGLKRCFPKEELEQLGRTSGFIRRSTSQLTGSNFLSLNISESLASKSMSLRECCIWLEDEFGLSIKKQSLDERYNAAAVLFMKHVFNRVLKHVNGCSPESRIDFPFSCVQLTDATSFKIPDSLSKFYEGFGGNLGIAMLKIHLNYNLLDGSVRDISFRSAKENDKKYLFGEGEEVVENGLYIRDLGYFHVRFFRELVKKEAYFLSRGLSNAAYHIKTDSGYKRLDLANVLPSKTGSIEKEVYLGNKKEGWVKCRLLLEKVPEQIREERLKRLARKERQGKNRKVSDFRKQLCGYNLFITNAPEELLSRNMVWYAYRMRWQIELIFKIWKSTFNIHRVRKMNIYRFECHLYASLISILLSLNIQGELGGFLWNEYEYEISPQKAVEIVKKNPATD